MDLDEKRALALAMFDSRKQYRHKSKGFAGIVTSVDHFGNVSLHGQSIYVVYDPADLEEIDETTK